MNILSVVSILQTVGYVMLALLVLLVMITIHEFGHYIVGKAFKFKINEFAIGFGPAIYKKTRKNGEIFSIRVIPFGGYCAFSGEDEEAEDENSFNNKKPYQRILVLIAGALMNIILAIFVLMLCMGIYGQSFVKINSVLESETTSSYVFEDGDVILAVENKNIYLATDLISALNDKEQGDLATVTVLRDGEKTDIQIMLATDTDFENIESLAHVYKALGVGIVEIDDVSYYDISASTVKFGFFETIGRSFEYSTKIAGTIFTVLGELLTGKLGVDSLGGPITTITTTASGVAMGGFKFLLEITAFIGINLGVFNLLPLPALDGSRVVFCGIEWIRKKPVYRKIEAIIHTFGFLFLLGFAFLVDFLKLF